jgi:hypothetical protein
MPAIPATPEDRGGSLRFDTRIGEKLIRKTPILTNKVDILTHTYNLTYLRGISKWFEIMGQKRDTI